MPLSLHQVVALVFCYRRLVVAWGMVPLAVLVAPLLLSVVAWFLHVMTGGYSLLTILLTVTMLATAHRLIHELAPTPASLEKALAANQVRLPILAFCCSCVLVRTCVGPMGVWMGFVDWQNGNPSTLSWRSLSECLRASAVFGTLGLAVVARFVGPQSVMRCSTFPLASNPMVARIQSVLTHPATLFWPDPPGGFGTPPPTLSSSGQAAAVVVWQGRRVQQPGPRAVAAQVVCALVAAVALHVLAGGMEPQASSPTAALVAHVLVVLGPLVVHVLDGRSHELDPVFHNNDTALAQWTSLAFWGRWMVLAAMWTTATLLVATAAAWLYDEVETLAALVPLGLSVAGMFLYALVLHVVFSTVLFVPRLSLKRLVSEVYDDPTPMAQLLQVILDSLLLGNANFVKDVWTPSQRPGVMDLEAEERRRTLKYSQQLATLYLSRTNNGQAQAPLEEDIIRISVLEAFGGGPKVSSRHDKIVKEWVDWRFAKGGLNREPVAVPLVRALAVTAGGLGEALVRCSMQAPLSSNRLVTWKLPRAAILSARFTVTAISRCLVHSLTESGRPLADYKSAQLSMLVPAALQSIFLLRTGVVQFNRSNASSRHTTAARVSQHIGVQNPELMDILRACDEAATDILKSLKGLGRVNLQLDQECLDWSKTLIASSSRDPQQRQLALVN